MILDYLTTENEITIQTIDQDYTFPMDKFWRYLVDNDCLEIPMDSYDENGYVMTVNSTMTLGEYFDSCRAHILLDVEGFLESELFASDLGKAVNKITSTYKPTA